MNKNFVTFVRENAKAMIFLMVTIMGGTFLVSSGLTSYTSRSGSTAFISCFKSCVKGVEEVKFASDNLDLDYDKDGAKIVVGRKSEAQPPSATNTSEIQVDLDTKMGKLSGEINIDNNKK